MPGRACCLLLGYGRVEPAKPRVHVAPRCAVVVVLLLFCCDVVVVVAYMSRLGALLLLLFTRGTRLLPSLVAGLWGEGTAFATFTEFYSALDEGGVGAMELIALDMKRRGMYISRQLSFKSAEFETAIIDLTSRQRAMYDAASKFWSEMFG